MIGAVAMAMASAAAVGLDCPVSFATEVPGKGIQKQGDAKYVFTFLPAEKPESKAELLFSVTLWDGRSWRDSGQIFDRKGDSWPQFEATASVSGSYATFKSDPAHVGNVNYRAVAQLTDGAGTNIIEGTCTFIQNKPERG